MIPTIKNYIPRASVVVLAPEMQFVAMTIHALRADVDGTCYARLRGDADDAWRTYTITAGDYAYGDFSAVRLGTYSEGELIALIFPTE